MWNFPSNGDLQACEAHLEQFHPLLPLLLFFCSLAFIVRNRRFNRHRLPLLQLFFQSSATSTSCSSSSPIALCRLSSKHGPLMLLQLGQIPTIVASSPEIADEILKAQDHIFCGRPYVTVTHRFSYGGLDIAFAPHDDRWRLLRRLAKSRSIRFEQRARFPRRSRGGGQSSARYHILCGSAAYPSI
ncbi:hypothetical protein HPP92_011119 [Vanilla planifolia]|uniref:Cytochrome P450 n=1 Tax=Vanilla planifolia TaxID=51239 RepID=A0A835QV40_VANPL|nr:hypothetical protein HPP92_011119 [Vanilla planifolia]